MLPNMVNPTPPSHFPVSAGHTVSDLIPSCGARLPTFDAAAVSAGRPTDQPTGPGHPKRTTSTRSDSYRLSTQSLRGASDERETKGGAKPCILDLGPAGRLNVVPGISGSVKGRSSQRGCLVTALETALVFGTPKRTTDWFLTGMSFAVPPPLPGFGGTC